MTSSIRRTPDIRQNKRKNSFCFSVFNPASPMSDHGSPQMEQTINEDASPTHKAQKHDNTSGEQRTPNERLVKVGPRTVRIGRRSDKIPPVTLDSIVRSQCSNDPLDQIHDAVYMHASATTPAAMAYSPSLGFGGLSLTSPSPGNALGLTTSPAAEPPYMPSFLEALAMSRHASDADITSLPFGSTSYDSRSTIVSNQSYDSLYSPDTQNYHGSSSICFPSLPTPPSLPASLAPGNKDLPDQFSAHFADADDEPEQEQDQLYRLSLAELRRGSTSHVPGPVNLFKQGRADPHSQTMPQLAHTELPRIRSTSFKGEAFVFPAPPKTLSGGPSAQSNTVEARPPPPTYPPPLLPSNYVASTNEPSSGKLSAGFGRFWKLGFKSDKRASRLLPQLSELRSQPPVETSPDSSLRVVDESIFDFTRYAADEEESLEQASRPDLEDSVEVEDEEEEEEITMDSLERMAGPFDQQEITMESLTGVATGAYEVDDEDEDYDDVSEDDFPGCDTFQLRMRSDPGYLTEEDWIQEAQRYQWTKAQKAAAGPNPAHITISELVGTMLCADFAQKYAIIDELGSGGYGFVCVAMNREGKEVAVKFIRKFREPNTFPLAMAGDEPLESFVLRNINHPNIVGYVERFEDDRFYYLVQELHGDPWHRARLVARNEEEDDSGRNELAQIHTATRRHLGQLPESGPSSSSGTPVLSPAMSGSPFSPYIRPGAQRRPSYDLFEAIENREFSEFQCRHIFQQLVDALLYLHKSGVYHRDLKDENVVIDQNLNVKLIDFGSAVCEDTRLEPKRYVEFKGTDAYAAPEIYPKGKAQYEAAPTDIWALGLLLSMILTRSMPFTEGDMKYRFQLRSEVPEPAYEIIRACLRINPRERPTIDQIASHYWLSGEYIKDLAGTR